MNAIAIITARGGSKRIPRKNIRSFLGKPIIAYAIETAKKSNLFEQIVISTDDHEIKQIAESFGGLVPFIRPSFLSDDTATTDDVLLHAIKECQKLWGCPEYVCCIYPTSPFLTEKYLTEAFVCLKEHKAVSSFPIVSYDFPVEQAFLLENNKPIPRWPELILKRSQDLPMSYHDAGMFYWVDTRKFLKVKKIFNEDMVAIQIPNNLSQDINTLEDWHMAEIKFKILSSHK